MTVSRNNSQEGEMSISIFSTAISIFCNKFELGLYAKEVELKSV